MSELASFDFDRLREAIVRVFEERATHEVPPALPAPPLDWAGPYRALAEEVGLDPNPAAGHRLAAAFLDPVVAGDRDARQWDASSAEWRR